MRFIPPTVLTCKPHSLISLISLLFRILKSTLRQNSSTIFFFLYYYVILSDICKINCMEKNIFSLSFSLYIKFMKQENLTLDSFINNVLTFTFIWISFLFGFYFIFISNDFKMNKSVAEIMKTWFDERKECDFIDK